MKNPNGVECPYFYGDYYRGKNFEECRLCSGQTPSIIWSPELCKNCPVPAIKRANACEFMVLTPILKKSLLGSKKHLTISAFCSKSNSNVKTPEIGCGTCHQISNLFEEK